MYKGRSTKWGDANRHREHHLGFSCKHKVSQLVNRLRFIVAGWCFILLLPSEFICMQTFGFLDHLRLTHCNMLIGCFPWRSSRRGLGSVERRSCSASGRMIISAHSCLGLLHAQDIPAACPASSWPYQPHTLTWAQCLSLAPERGWKHHMPCQKWCLDAMQPTGTHEHSLPSCLPSFGSSWSSSELFCCKIPSLLLGWVEIGQWIQTILWAADRQADRQRDCESFISARNWAKNDSLSQGSLSSMPQTKVGKTERKCFTDSNGYGANSRSAVNFLPYHNLSVWPPANHITFLILCFFYVKQWQRFGVLSLGEG